MCKKEYEKYGSLQTTLNARKILFFEFLEGKNIFAFLRKNIFFARKKFRFFLFVIFWSHPFLAWQVTMPDLTPNHILSRKVVIRLLYVSRIENRIEKYFLEKKIPYFTFFQKIYKGWGGTIHCYNFSFLFKTRVQAPNIVGTGVGGTWSWPKNVRTRLVGGDGLHRSVTMILRGCFNTPLEISKSVDISPCPYNTNTFQYFP